MTSKKVFTISVFLTAALMATLTSASQSIEPIWLSPLLVGTYEPEYPELGVWANTSVGAGSRLDQPIVAMDSNKTLWLLFGSSFGLPEYNVWNYDPQTDLYRWVTGPGNSTTDPRNPGELRVPSPDNHPGQVVQTPGAIDHNDNIWFMPSHSAQNLGELWMFNTTSRYFTRMKGLHGEIYEEVYGTLGQPGDDVLPVLTFGGCLVVDSQNNLWQIAGMAYSSAQNNIWHFNTTSYQWIFFGGNISDYGTQLVQTVYGNDPYYGSRAFQSCDIDYNDRVWLFGGFLTGYGGLTYNDVWSYDTRTLQWRLEFGSNASINANATIAVEDNFDAGNHPAAVSFASFTDRKDGTLMLVNAQIGSNDIWQFHKTLKQWKLVYGDPFNANQTGDFSHYRTPGSVMPGYQYRRGSAHGLNTDGDVFVYGGGTYPVLYNNGGIIYNSIWLIPQDQCTTSTSNCSSNARCIELDVGYSCECNDGFTGDGFTCESTLPPLSPTSPSPSDEPVAPPLSSSQPSSTPHRKTQVSRGVTVESSLFLVLSLVVCAVLLTMNRRCNSVIVRD